MAGIPTESPLAFAGISSVGSSRNRLSSAEDYEEAWGMRSPWGQHGLSLIFLKVADSKESSFTFLPRSVPISIPPVLSLPPGI